VDWLSDPQNWIALVTLTTLEIILGIDNIVVISILSGKLPPHRRQQARTIGLSLALITRILLLLSLSWLIGLTAEAGKEGAGKNRPRPRVRLPTRDHRVFGGSSTLSMKQPRLASNNSWPFSLNKLG